MPDVRPFPRPNGVRLAAILLLKSLSLGLLLGLRRRHENARGAWKGVCSEGERGVSEGPSVACRMWQAVEPSVVNSGGTVVA